MNKFFLAIFSSSLMLSSLYSEEIKDPKIEFLKQLVHEKYLETNTFKEALTDPSDIYTTYFLYGKQKAYEEVLLELVILFP